MQSCLPPKEAPFFGSVGQYPEAATYSRLGLRRTLAPHSAVERVYLTTFSVKKRNINDVGTHATTQCCAPSRWRPRREIEHELADTA